jgi:hypothetical protein
LIPDAFSGQIESCHLSFCTKEPSITDIRASGGFMPIGLREEKIDSSGVTKQIFQAVTVSVSIGKSLLVKIIQGRSPIGTYRNIQAVKKKIDGKRTAQQFIACQVFVQFINRIGVNITPYIFFGTVNTVHMGRQG